MDPFWIGLIGVIGLLVLIILGVHVAISLGLVGMVGMACIMGPEAALYASTTLTLDRVTDYALAIIPLYVLMGALAQEGGISSGTYECLRLWFGRFRGGLGIATVGGCTLFGTVCGSSMVTATVFAQLTAPEMRRMGYQKHFAYAICSSGGVIGMLIPPSILVVVYGILSGDSIGRLLIGAASPGIALFIIFSLGITIMTHFNPNLAGKIESQATWRERLISLKLLWEVFLIVGIVFGGIFTGIFSPQDAGAVACTALLFIYLLSGKSWEGIKDALCATISTSAMIFLMLAGAGLFSRFLVVSTVAPKVLNFLLSFNLTPLSFFVIVSIVYLVLGCFFDSFSMLTITLPLLHPAAMKFGIDPIHFGIVVIVAIEIGLLTPPVGLNVYAVKGVAEEDVTLEDLFSGILPFVIMMCLCLALYILFPILSTILPDMMMGK